MADEITVQFTMAEPEDEVRARWRTQPPGFLSGHGYDLVDESFRSLVFERDHSRLTKLLTWGMSRTVYRLTLTLRSDAVGGTAVTVSGQASDAAREEIVAFAASQA